MTKKKDKIDGIVIKKDGSEIDMVVKTRRSACQNHPKNSVVYILHRRTSQTD